MHKGRLEAFSDGVLAILITIMVLELKTPHGAGLEGLRALMPVFFSYVLSFIYLGIYWSNHHHLFQATQRVSGGVLWANLHLLFWLSLIPFVTSWAGENHFVDWPVALYGVVLLMSAVAYFILENRLLAHHSKDSALARALERDFKGKFSVLLYAVAIPLAFWQAWLAILAYIVIAVWWLIPDRRIEKALLQK